MNGIYLGLVVFLFILAVFDLMVGVSNDAVNFLNSAIGAKVAKFKTIILIAAMGVLVGAISSNGMMDIARNGIFNPREFAPMELMTIFLAVMVTDVILLDLFNSFGMPTSTTVSMVFELLGAAFSLALLKTTGDPSLSLGGLINTDKSLAVISAIFVSVPIAFTFGALIQWLSRVLFSFTYKGKLRWKIGLFGGLSAACIIYFMLVKGMKNMSFMSSDLKAFIGDNTGLIFLGCFVFFAVLSEVLNALRVNVFKMLVLLGTFSLAMAFAGNDLVNFIGVPLAGYSVFKGEDLSTPARTPICFLIAAGAVMVISLATSKKARNVTKTEIGLGSQDGSDEMFGTSRIARVIVRSCRSVGGALGLAVPLRFKHWAEGRFDRSQTVCSKGASFDEVRATTNLVVASLLIALGTSLKLPLSTTYVTFMVAMGSSLSDRAWSRESAVYRVTGVFSVIGGWFLTALVAFTASFVVALAMHMGGTVMIVIMMLLALFLLVRSNLRFRRRQEKGPEDPVFEQMMDCTSPEGTLDLLKTHVRDSQEEFLLFAAQTYRNVTDGFMTENIHTLDKSEDKMRRERGILKNTRRKEMLGLRRIDTQTAIEKNTWFHLGRNSCENILYCLRRICDQCQEHVDNSLTPLEQEKAKVLTPLRDKVEFLIKLTADAVRGGSSAVSNEFSIRCREVEEELSDARHAEARAVQTPRPVISHPGVQPNMMAEWEPITLSYVYMNVLLESQTLVNELKELVRANRKFSE